MELSGTPLLAATGVRVERAGRTLVDVDALALEAGEVLAILGPNGAGKSTLFRVLLRQEREQAGTVRLEGRALGPGDDVAARRMAGVFQRPHLFAGTVATNVGFGLRARGVRRDERERRTREALDLMGLEPLAGRDVHTLSGGEAQRTAVARALAVDPDVLLLDEPTANLDVTVRRRFREDLERAVRKRARGVILITHDAADAFALADRVAVMEAGRFVQTGPPDAIVLEPATPFVAELTGADLLLDGVLESAEARLVVVRTKGGALVRGLATTEPPPAGTRVHASYRPEDVTLVSAEDRGTTSAINRFEVTVVSMVPAGAMARVRLDGAVSLIALVTRQSVEALGLEPGTDVEAHLKATAVRVYGAG